MSNSTGKISALLSIALVSVLMCPVSSICADQPSASADAPKVASITQVTHDGVGKTNLLSDDSNLYVTEWSAARHVMAKVSLRNSDRSLISTSFSNVEALDVSPDGKLLIAPMQGAARDNEFWTVAVNSGVPERLGQFTGRDASWSADGRQLTFSRGAVIYLANSDGTAMHEVFQANGTVFAPHISADGRRIRFTVGNTAQNTTSLWEVGVDGSNPHALLGDWQGSQNACCGNWTADGRYYIFQVTQNRPTTLTTLWALADSSSTENAVPFQLTKGPISFGNIAPSRDDKKIWAIGVQPAGEAVKFNPERNKFTPLLSGVSATDLDYSPDGKWVTYVSIPDGELYRSRADGTEQMRLTSAPERAVLPHWSKDLSQIAYVSMQPGKPWRICTISVAGGAAHAILDEDQGQIDANWSADGHHIMYGYVYGSEHLSIKIVDLKTHQVETIPGSEGLFSPRWSPNGRYIAALTPDFTKVMLFDFQTKKWMNWLTEPAGAVSYPVWSADSKSLYFDDLVTDQETIRQVRVGDRHTEKVFKLEGIERYPGAFGLWAGQMPDGSWMFVRDRSTQEVYQLAVELP